MVITMDIKQEDKAHAAQWLKEFSGPQHERSNFC